MKKNRILLFIFLLLEQASFSQIREVKHLDSTWKFKKGNSDNAFEINFDDSKWETVSVPHDWAIYGPFDKEIDKQSVAITQNGEHSASEKTGR
jgi:beta-galactosidase